MGVPYQTNLGTTIVGFQEALVAQLQGAPQRVEAKEPGKFRDFALSTVEELQGWTVRFGPEFNSDDWTEREIWVFIEPKSGSKERIGELQGPFLSKYESYEVTVLVRAALSNVTPRQIEIECIGNDVTTGVVQYIERICNDETNLGYFHEAGKVFYTGIRRHEVGTNGEGALLCQVYAGLEICDVKKFNA